MRHEISAFASWWLNSLDLQTGVSLSCVHLFLVLLLSDPVEAGDDLVLEDEPEYSDDSDDYEADEEDVGCIACKLLKIRIWTVQPEV